MSLLANYATAAAICFSLFLACVFAAAAEGKAADKREARKAAAADAADVAAAAAYAAGVAEGRRVAANDPYAYARNVINDPFTRRA